MTLFSYQRLVVRLIILSACFTTDARIFGAEANSMLEAKQLLRARVCHLLGIESLNVDSMEVTKRQVESELPTGYSRDQLVARLRALDINNANSDISMSDRKTEIILDVRRRYTASHGATRAVGAAIVFKFDSLGKLMHIHYSEYLVQADIPPEK